uniref:Uncharacterized protein n=1 Tax=viral metagenome TaxID=1070528 RepID=A0A6C0KIC6_9ZZZZ
MDFTNNYLNYSKTSNTNDVVTNYNSSFEQTYDDSSFNELYDNMNDMNTKVRDFVSHRSNTNPIGDSGFDGAMMDSYKANMLYLNEKNMNEIQYMKQTSNRIKNLKNASNNNKLINQIINGNPNTQYKIHSKGEMEILDDEIQQIREKNETNNRHVKINEYYKKKREHQIRYFKICSIILGLLFFFGLSYKAGAIHEALFMGIMGLGITILIAYTIYTCIDMYFRDKIIYDEYAFFGSSFFGRKVPGTMDNTIPLRSQDDLVSEKCYISNFTTNEDS